MANVVIEDLSGQISCTLFPATYAKFKGLVQKDNVVRLKGNVSHRERPGSGGEKQIEILVDEIAFLPAPEVVSSLDTSILGTVFVRLLRATKKQLELFKTLASAFPGSYEVVFQFGEAVSSVPYVSVYRVDPSEEFLSRARRSFADAKIDIVSNDSIFLPPAKNEEPTAVSAR